MVSEGSHAQVDIKLQICSKNYGYHTFFADLQAKFADLQTKFADLQTNLQICRQICSRLYFKKLS